MILFLVSIWKFTSKFFSINSPYVTKTNWKSGISLIIGTLWILISIVHIIFYDNVI